MNPHDNKDYLLSDQDNPSGPRSITSLMLVALCAALLFALFVALGSWQIKRLYWKQSLIERVEQRVSAPAVNVPDPAHWNKVTADSDEYRHVRVRGRFLNELSTQVQASTVHGRGFWVMTPLLTENGHIIFINRGFIRYGSSACVIKPDVNANGAFIEVTGLLRVSENGGAFLRRNNPDLQQWYSRDVFALAASKHLLNVANVAPFFIDAEAQRNVNGVTDANCHDPIAGLTVIAFHNNHLVYAVTWYTLALMVLVGCFIFWRTELKIRSLKVS